MSIRLKYNQLQEKLQTIMVSRKRAYKTLEETPEGKIILSDLYKYCGGNRLSHTDGDSHKTAYNEGRRSVLLHIQAILNQDDRRAAEIVQDHVNNITPKG